MTEIKNTKKYDAPFAEIVKVNLKALMLWSGGVQDVGTVEEQTTVYQEDESVEW